MWPPSLLPSCSKMSLTSPRLQVFIPSKPIKALKEKGGKMSVRREKRRGERERGCKTVYSVSWFKKCEERERHGKRRRRGKKSHWITLLNQNGLFLPSKGCKTLHYDALLPRQESMKWRGYRRVKDKRVFEFKPLCITAFLSSRKSQTKRCQKGFFLSLS